MHQVIAANATLAESRVGSSASRGNDNRCDTLRKKLEGVVEAEVHSAFELSDAQLHDLVQRLEKKTGRKVRAQVSVDRELIGGVKIVLGDKVIDGSARAQLGALEAALKA